MNSLRLNHQPKKRKTWLFPLIVIILLYFTIPFVLIQRGDDSLNNAISETEVQSVELPSKKYKEGIVFIEIAESFPGYTAWAKQIKQKAGKQMQNIYKIKCDYKSKQLFNKISSETTSYDSLSVNFEKLGDIKFLNAAVYRKKNKENIKIAIPKDLETELQDKFCRVWDEFFQDLQINTKNNNSICQL
ncbi:MAG: hypothetical protein B6I20_07495 [Bacteroidetes bacterium 4572_117]|nr:MAG: hypothetical protein B6I20_07495 [Bacteroidetes bacterium 4572_117]